MNDGIMHWVNKSKNKETDSFRQLDLYESFFVQEDQEPDKTDKPPTMAKGSPANAESSSGESPPVDNGNNSNDLSRIKIYNISYIVGRPSSISNIYSTIHAGLTKMSALRLMQHFQLQPIMLKQ